MLLRSRDQVVLCGLHTDHIHYAFPCNLVVKLQDIMEILNSVLDVAHRMMTHNVLERNNNAIVAVAEGFLRHTAYVFADCRSG